jgi:hypothetical protein
VTAAVALPALFLAAGTVLVLVPSDDELAIQVLKRDTLCQHVKPVREHVAEPIEKPSSRDWSRWVSWVVETIVILGLGCVAVTAGYWAIDLPEFVMRAYCAAIGAVAGLGAFLVLLYLEADVSDYLFGESRYTNLAIRGLALVVVLAVQALALWRFNIDISVKCVFATIDTVLLLWALAPTLQESEQELRDRLRYQDEENRASRKHSTSADGVNQTEVDEFELTSDTIGTRQAPTKRKGSTQGLRLGPVDEMNCQMLGIVLPRTTPIEGNAVMPWVATVQQSDSAPLTVEGVEFRPGGEMSGLGFFSNPIAGTVLVTAQGRVISTEILEEHQHGEAIVHALMVTNHLIKEGCPMTPADTKSILRCLERLRASGEF